MNVYEQPILLLL